jgi:protoheme IX farnesyltransferase
LTFKEVRRLLQVPHHGRVRLRDAILVGAALALAGTLGLSLRFNTLSALLALATLLAYVLVYTPLKRVSTLNTAIGAIPGAMPPLLGFVAFAGDVHGWGWYLFAVLFAWQFPHFLAIAWMYREDYARAGLPMLPVLDPAGHITGRQAVANCLALLLVSVVPSFAGMTSRVYLWGALVLGIAFTAAAVVAATQRTTAAARALFLTSVLYLALLSALLLATRV